jgi:hypothetical protein
MVHLSNRQGTNLQRLICRGIESSADGGRVHVGIQATGTDPAIQATAKLGEFLGRPVLAIVSSPRGRPLAAPCPLAHSRLEAAYGRDDHFAFCLYTVGNVDGRHSGTIKLLEAAG